MSVFGCLYDKIVH